MYCGGRSFVITGADAVRWMLIDETNDFHFEGHLVMYSASSNKLKGPEGSEMLEILAKCLRIHITFRI